MRAAQQTADTPKIEEVEKKWIAAGHRKRERVVHNLWRVFLLQLNLYPKRWASCSFHQTTTMVVIQSRRMGRGGTLAFLQLVVCWIEESGQAYLNAKSACYCALNLYFSLRKRILLVADGTCFILMVALKFGNIVEYGNFKLFIFPQ